ncbi:hypothetical protein L195_g005589 [Trifolium pratense]|uniref:Ulp1 protease family carboxy-terminal domain protein n=1 Tax=Trifolium pratense TaxID=57577 RepID=A0A2K3P178_TRIPR|nr:hypothetical protein L195_g005589 [Trifolium pratense]
MEGSNEKHISANASAEQVDKRYEEGISVTSKLDKNDQQALMEELGSRIPMIFSTLDDIVGIVKKQAIRMDMIELNMDRITSGLDDSVVLIKNNVKSTEKFHEIFKGLVNKLDKIQDLLTKQTPKGKTALSPSILSTPKTTLSPSTMSTPKTTLSPSIMSTPSSSRNAMLSPMSVSPFNQTQDLSNIVFIPSSDEEDIQKRRRLSKKAINKTSSSSVSLNVDKMPTSKLPSKGRSAKASNAMTPEEVESLVGRMLSFIPSPKIHGMNLPKTEPLQTLKEYHESHFNDKTPILKSVNPTGHTLSKFIKTLFPVTPSMNMTADEAHVAAYIFHPKNKADEVLFKLGDFEGKRKDFQTLCPFRTINSEIMHMMALKINWTQQQMSDPTKWVLPPTFLDAINMGQTIEELVEEFAPYWMPPYENLSHIYIPYEDVCGLWFLMVASMEDKIIHHLEPSYIVQATIEARQDIIQKVWDVITEMSQSPSFPAPFITQTMTDNRWYIVDPNGNLGTGFCQHSAVYVMDWMDKEFPLKSDDVLGEKNEDVLRMRIALNLILGDHNDVKAKVEEAAAEAWNSRRFA